MQSDRMREEMVALLPRLRRFAYSMSGSLEEADDLVQTACERALSRCEQFEPGTRLDSWMFRMIQTSWIDRKRYEGRRQQVNAADLENVLSFDARIHEQTEARSILTIIRNEMDQLSDDQRAVIALVVLEGKSYQEVSDILSVPIGTVMSRLARARQKLTEIVNKTPAVLDRSEGQRK